MQLLNWNTNQNFAYRPSSNILFTSICYIYNFFFITYFELLLSAYVSLFFYVAHKIRKIDCLLPNHQYFNARKVCIFIYLLFIFFFLISLIYLKQPSSISFLWVLSLLLFLFLSNINHNQIFWLYKIPLWYSLSPTPHFDHFSSPFKYLLFLFLHFWSILIQFLLLHFSPHLVDSLNLISSVTLSVFSFHFVLCTPQQFTW